MTEYRPQKDTTPFAYTPVLAVGTGLVLWVLLLWRLDVEAALLLWSISMVLLLAGIQATVFVITGLIVIWPITGIRGVSRIPNPVLPGVDDFAFSIFVLTFVALAFALQRTMSDYWARRRQMGDEQVNRPPPTGPSPVFAGLIAIPCCVLLSSLFLAMIPESMASLRQFRLRPPALRAIELSWVLALLWFFLVTVFGIIHWIRMSRDEARVLLRSEIARESGRDLAALERRRARYRKRLEKKRQRGTSLT